jgi:EAL domain-containing protein (putative c-di-GMP-specific phosphodiesterase class I)
MEQGKPFSATESPHVDFDAVCQKVRAAVEPARAHAVSLHDERGDLLWLTESSMGPDEHNAVREAIEAFSGSDAPPALAYDLGDFRSALLLRAVNASRAMVGAVMLVVDTRVIKKDARGNINVMTPKLQRALADFAGMRPDTAPAVEPAPASAPVPPAKAGLASVKTLAKSDSPARKVAPTAVPAPPKPPAAARPAPARPSPPPAAARTSAPAPHASAPRAPAPSAAPRPASPRTAPPRAAPPGEAPPREASHRTAPARDPAAHANGSPLELSLVDSVRVPAAKRHAATAPVPQAAPAPVQAQRAQQEVTPEIDRLHAALRRSPIALHVQRLVPLAKGSQLKRYEVLLRSKSDEAPDSAPQAMLKAAVDNGLGSMIDRRVVTELIGWLVHHPDVWQTNAVMFSVNLTTTALHDEHFIKFVGLCLAKSSLPKSMIAFEVDVPTATKLATRIAEVAAALDRLGCPMVLDDFALRTECFDLLRLPGVRYIKLAPEITAKMRTDKLSQAAITAVVQMARVLGMHTVAKRTETSAEQEWLTALGVDFIQSYAMSPPAAIDSLSKGQKARS